MYTLFSKNVSKLKFFIAIEIILIVLYRFWDALKSTESTIFWQDWFFLLALAFGVFTVLYAFNIKCKNPECAARQVFRGWSIFDIRWPSRKCYKCGRELL